MGLDVIIDTHADAAGRLCHDEDGDYCCDECGVSLSDCWACDGIGYHEHDCPECEEG